VSESAALPLEELWARYRADAVAYLDNHEKSRADDAGRAQVLLGFFGDECDVRKLSESDQLAFIRKRLAGGIDCGDGRVTDPVRSRSVEADLKLLHTMLNWARTVRLSGGRRLLDQNPLVGIRRPPEKNPRRPVATWQRYQATRAAIQKLTESATSDAERRKWLKLELALILAEATGRRLGSIRQLAWPDIDFARGTILWRANADKKGKSWNVPLTDVLHDQLKVFRGKLGGVFGGLVFPSESDPAKPIRTDVFARWLLAAEKKAKLPKLDGSLWHAYRRAWATARKHLPAADVAAAGGWSDLTTLLRCYQQVDEETLLAVMNEPRKVSERIQSA
jgi:integrase